MRFASPSLSSQWIRKVWLFLLVVTMNSKIGLVADAFSAAASPSPSLPSINNKDWLVVDFDGTCTVRDTITMLPRLAALAQSRLPQTDLPNFPKTSDALSPDAAVDFQGRLSIFSMLEDEYFRQYTEVQKLIRETAHNDDDDEDDDANRLEQLAISLDKLDDVSTEITHEVSRWRVLGGLGDVSHDELLGLIELYKEHQDELEPGTGDVADRKEKLNQLLDCLSLRKGCLSVLQKSRPSYDIGVLSINWCPALIESLVVHPLCNTVEKDEEENSDESTQQLGFEDVPIWSNTLDEEGVVALPFPGAISKREKILELQRQQGQHNDGGEVSGRVVYIGDSSTDLLAILQADVGILLGGSKSATSLATKFGVPVKPLGDYEDTKKEVSTVWTANDWEEIGSFLER